MDEAAGTTQRQALRAGARRAAAGFANLSLDLIYGLRNCPSSNGGGRWTTFCRRRAAPVGLPPLRRAPHGTRETLRARRVPPGRRAPERSALRAAARRADRRRIPALRNIELRPPRLRVAPQQHYWKGSPLPGRRSAAHSFDGDRRRWNVSDVREYLRKEPEERSTKPRRSPRRTHTTSSL